MCDCYAHKCEICEETIPMHIGDFNFPREDFKVYCHKHINQAPIGAVVFELVNDHFKEFDPGWKCAIFGPEVGQTNDGDNHPNVAGEFKEWAISEKFSAQQVNGTDALKRTAHLHRTPQYDKKLASVKPKSIRKRMKEKMQGIADQLGL